MVWFDMVWFSFAWLVIHWWKKKDLIRFCLFSSSVSLVLCVVHWFGLTLHGEQHAFNTNSIPPFTIKALQANRIVLGFYLCSLCCTGDQNFLVETSSFRSQSVRAASRRTRSYDCRIMTSLTWRHCCVTSDSYSLVKSWSQQSGHVDLVMYPPGFLGTPSVLFRLELCGCILYTVLRLVIRSVALDDTGGCVSASSASLLEFCCCSQELLGCKYTCIWPW